MFAYFERTVYFMPALLEVEFVNFLLNE